MVMKQLYSARLMDERKCACRGTVGLYQVKWQKCAVRRLYEKDEQVLVLNFKLLQIM